MRTCPHLNLSIHFVSWFWNFLQTFNLNDYFLIIFGSVKSSKQHLPFVGFETPLSLWTDLRAASFSSMFSWMFRRSWPFAVNLSSFLPLTLWCCGYGSNGFWIAAVEVFLLLSMAINVVMTACRSIGNRQQLWIDSTVDWMKSRREWWWFFCEYCHHAVVLTLPTTSIWSVVFNLCIAAVNVLLIMCIMIVVIVRIVRYD